MKLRLWRKILSESRIKLITRITRIKGVSYYLHESDLCKSAMQLMNQKNSIVEDNEWVLLLFPMYLKMQK